MKYYMRAAVLLIATVGLLAGSQPLLQAGDHAYIGSKKCKMCHLKEWDSWSTTRMANAFDHLKPGDSADAKKAAGLDPQKDYTKDATCLACHTTGYGSTGGFVSMESTPDLAGVGCEMCHGPGGTYTQNQYMSLKNKEYKKADVVAAGMTDQVTVKQCGHCHNPSSPFVGDDYVFDFDANKEKGTHEKFALKYQH